MKGHHHYVIDEYDHDAWLPGAGDDIPVHQPELSRFVVVELRVAGDFYWYAFHSLRATNKRPRDEDHADGDTEAIASEA